jgi:hypothetical protein
MTHQTPRRAAEELFLPPVADKGSNSEKLQDLRQRQILRQRELRVTERQLRLKARPKAGTA